MQRTDHTGTHLRVQLGWGYAFDMHPGRRMLDGRMLAKSHKPNAAMRTKCWQLHSSLYCFCIVPIQRVKCRVTPAPYGSYTESFSNTAQRFACSCADQIAFLHIHQHRQACHRGCGLHHLPRRHVSRESGISALWPHVSQEMHQDLAQATRNMSNVSCTPPGSIRFSCFE